MIKHDQTCVLSPLYPHHIPSPQGPAFPTHSAAVASTAVAPLPLGPLPWAAAVRQISRPLTRLCRDPCHGICQDLAILRCFYIVFLGDVMMF